MSFAAAVRSPSAGTQRGSTACSRERAAAPSRRSDPNIRQKYENQVRRLLRQPAAVENSACLHLGRRLQPFGRSADSPRVRLWIVIILVVCASATTARHVVGHRHPVVIPLLVVPALLLGWQESNFRNDQNEFSGIASEIAGRDVRIECQRFTGALLDPTAEAGYVQFNADGSPTDTGRLERDACNDLRGYFHGDKASPTLRQVISVQVLAHESYHLAGIHSEAETECAAIQRLDDVASSLGATPSEARTMAERYYDEIYPNMPTAYQSSECRDDGELDASPDNTEWP